MRLARTMLCTSKKLGAEHGYVVEFVSVRGGKITLLYKLEYAKNFEIGQQYDMNLSVDLDT